MLRSEGSEAFPLGRSASPAAARCSLPPGDRDRARSCSPRPRRNRSIRFTGGSSIDRGRGASPPLRMGRGGAVAERALFGATPSRCGRRGSSCMPSSPRSSSRSTLGRPRAVRPRRHRRAAARDAGAAGKGRRHVPTARRTSPTPQPQSHVSTSQIPMPGRGRGRWARLADPYWLATARYARRKPQRAAGATARAGRDAARGTPARRRPRCRTPDDRDRGRVTTDPTQHRTAGRGRSQRSQSISSASPHARPKSCPVAAGENEPTNRRALFVSEKTASVHVSNILRKLGVSSRVDAAAVAERLGVT